MQTIFFLSPLSFLSNSIVKIKQFFFSHLSPISAISLPKYKGPFGLELTQFSYLSSKTQNSNPKLKTQFSNLTFTQKLQNTCLDSVFSYISLQLFPKTVDPTTDTTQNSHMGTRVWDSLSSFYCSSSHHKTQQLISRLYTP